MTAKKLVLPFDKLSSKDVSQVGGKSAALGANFSQHLRPGRGHRRVPQMRPLDAREVKREGGGEKPHRQIASALHDSVAELGKGDAGSG